MKTGPGEPQGYIGMPDYLVPHDDIGFFLVKGDCMAGDGICDGDLVLADFGAEVADGDVAVVRSDHGGYVKQVFRAPGGVLLVPSSPVHKPIFLLDEVNPVIAAKVIGVLKRSKTG